MSRLPAKAFRRYDEAPDEEFYKTPRLVTHIDELAIAAVTQLYSEFFPADGQILDLMSSWVSHLPEEVRYGRVVGLGMNEVELRRNPRLDRYVVQNLNTNPRLPFGEAEFDGVGIPDYRYVLKPLLPLEGRRHLAPAGRQRTCAPRRELPPRGRELSERQQPRPQPAPPLFRPALRCSWGERGTVHQRRRNIKRSRRRAATIALPPTLSQEHRRSAGC